MASIRGGLFEDEPVQRSSRPGTGLAALFSNTQTTNVDLAYKPQKQPQSQPQPQTESPTVIFGVTVQLFQFDSTANKFVLKGKVGAAILGSRSAYQLLLYQNNKQQISVTSISSDFAYTIQNNVYGTYYDDSRQSWSLLFKDQPECNKFASYVAIAKAASTGFTAVKSQDIVVVPKGKGVSVGDSLGVKYSGWLIDEQFHIGALFDSNAEKEGFFKFVVGEGKVIRGWEEGVLGMKKGGKRLVAIPSHLAYGKNGYPPTIPANANLLFEIEIVRMKKGSNVDESASQLPALDTNDVESPGLMQNQGGGKSDLVARMAKVGRPAMGGVMTKSKELEDGMIPQRESETQDYSGMMSNLPVDTPHHHIQPMQMQPQPQMQHSQQQLQLQQQQLAQQQQLPQSQFGTVQQYPSQQAQPNINSYQYSVAPQTGYAQFSQYPQQTPVQNPVAPPASNPRATALSNSDAIQFLLEERQFQAEIKTNLSQVMSKVDDVHSKIESSVFFGKGKGQSKSDDYMSGLVIIQNVHRVVDENEKLRSELNQKGEAVDNLRSKISALLEKNEKLIQENTRLLEQRTDSLKESSTQSHKQIQELLDSKKKLEKELNEVQVQSADIESKYLALNRSVTAMKQELESSREDIQKKSHEIELLKSKEISSESSIKKLSSKLEEETTLRKSLQESNQALKDQLADEEENINRLKKEKEKEKTKFASTEARFKEKKAALKTQIAQLQQALKTEGMNKEEIEKMEQDFRNKLKKQEVEIATRVRQEIESIDKPNWEFHSFNKGKLEGIQQGALQGAQQAQADAELRTQAVRDQAFKEGKEAGYSQARIDLSSSTTTNPKQVEEAFQKGYSQGKQDGFVTGKQTGFNEGLAQGKQQSVSVSGNADVSKLLQEAKKERDETVKKVMNGVYFALYEEIDEDESYIGSRVLQLMMQTIKAKTLEMIQPDANSESQKQNQEHTQEASDNEEKPVDQTERATIQSELLQEEPAKEPSEELRSEQEHEDSFQTAQAEFRGADREEPTKEESDREEPAKEESDREEPAKEESDREEPTKEESDREEQAKEESDREPAKEESDREQAKEEADREEPAKKESDREEQAKEESDTEELKEESDADEKLPAQEQTTEELETVKESLGEPEHEIANEKSEGESATQAEPEPFDPLSSGQNDEELDVPPIDNTPSESATFEPPQQLSAAAEKSDEPDEEEEDDDFGSDNETNSPEPKGLEVDAESKLFDPLENLSDDPLKIEDRDDATKSSFLQTEEVEPVKAQSPSAVKNAKVSLFGADEDDTEDFFSQVKSVDVTPKKEAAPEPVKTPLSSTKVSLFGEDEDDGADFLGFFAKKT